MVEGINGWTERNECTIKFVSELNIYLIFRCPISGKTICKLSMQTKGKGYSMDESIKNAIQSFFNKDFYSSNYLVSDTPSHATELSNEIHHVEILVGEPFKSLFDQLFDDSNWIAPLELEEAT